MIIPSTNKNFNTSARFENQSHTHRSLYHSVYVWNYASTTITVTHALFEFNLSERVIISEDVYTVISLLYYTSHARPILIWWREVGQPTHTKCCQLSLILLNPWNLTNLSMIWRTNSRFHRLWKHPICWMYNSKYLSDCWTKSPWLQDANVGSSTPTTPYNHQCLR